MLHDHLLGQVLKKFLLDFGKLRFSTYSMLQLNLVGYEAHETLKH